MAHNSRGETSRVAPIFQGHSKISRQNLIPSSSPAFETLARPIVPVPAASILPIILPPATLRPIAFRVFTKKHSLTLSSSALQSLATFIGRHCGTEWRESGLAEPILEEIAKSWKARNGSVIVDGEHKDLKEIMKILGVCMVGGRIISPRELSRRNSLVSESIENVETNNSKLSIRSHHLGTGNNHLRLGSSETSLDEENLENYRDPRTWLKVIDAFEQPRLTYNVDKKYFDRETKKPTVFPPASHKTKLFRNRYNLIHQRLLRNELFHKPTFEPSTRGPRRTYSGNETSQQFYKLTPINNLLGRNGTNHLILGLLSISPTEQLSINDLTGSIILDLTHAKPVPEDGAWFTPGMIVLVDGVYIEDDNNNGTELGGGGGIGGCIGGKFIGFFVGGPPCERRKASLGLNLSENAGDMSSGGDFCWVDFLGVGSERAVGSKMRKIEQKVLQTNSIMENAGGRGRLVVLGEVNLDQPITLQALRKLLSHYASGQEEDSPMAFVFMGNFVQHAIMARGGSGGSIEYKENFDSLASVLSEFPTLLQNGTFIFVPGDNDGWASAFGAGASTIVPRKGIPDIFTSRIKRAFTIANAEAERENGHKTNGEAIWTSNPSRLSLFGPLHEIVLFRDDISSRLRRSAIYFSTPSNDGEITADQTTKDLDMCLATSTSSSPTSKINNVDPLSSNDPSLKPTIAVTDATTSTDIDTLYHAKKLVKAILDQGYLSPFSLTQRPVQWDYASSLQIYPLPTALVLADIETMAFVTTYEGCCVMNPGRLIVSGKKNTAGWVEYDTISRKSRVRELQF
ncbi:DNA polymerase epsilon subunit B [Erysiphe neolycopersici]|uniref:DNA polymerase epsilon subunit B n=1 Tax=Erysiphe neolycopersici TaxID=212602 RepID=A0A420HRE1_9PEZI|nr:DNA polymerase epsilon subunit B [Erysiphe neolycopersici]